MKSIFNNVFAVLTIAALLVGSALLAYPAVSQLAGLAVAQSATRWNSVIDAAKGDNQSSGILGISLYMWDGLNFDRLRGDTTNGIDVDVTRISGSTTPADDFANPTTTNTMFTLGAVFDGSTWDRVREATADALAVTGLQAASNMVFNGATWDRLRSISATNNVATTSLGAPMVANLSTWGVTNTTAGASAASASKGAGGGSVRHVATSITICYNDTAAATTGLQINLRDGATGAGTIIRSWIIAIPAGGDSSCVDLSGLNMTGSTNTAMTLEFAAAGSATSAKTVTLTGYSIP